MDFADAYLLKASLRDALIEPDPHPDLNIIVTIPVYLESGLTRCLDSLFQCQTGSGSSLHAEVLILVNAPADAPESILTRNRVVCNSAWRWIRDNPHPDIDFHVCLDHSILPSEAGVGMARKILMDEAVRRFSSLDRPGGIIASLDGDAVVEPGYLAAIYSHFGSEKCEGCAIYYEHPLSNEELYASGLVDPFEVFEGEPEKIGSGNNIPGQENSLSGYEDGPFPDVVYDAITRYELHLRYYVHSVRSTGYPYAFQTVGSAFAVRADVYCMEGGMSRRQGGEDFYFIQKVAQRGNFSECHTTRVVPSPRPSERVPFGTGPVVKRLIETGKSNASEGEMILNTYHPEPFRILKDFFSGMQVMYSEAAMDHFMKSQPGIMLEFLEKQQFGVALLEIRRNSASFEAFQKRFWRWFNMFRIMKFLHHARDNGFPDQPVEEAAWEFIQHSIPESGILPPSGTDPEELLTFLRKLDRS